MNIDPIQAQRMLFVALLAWVVAATYEIHRIDARDLVFILNYLPGAP